MSEIVEIEPYAARKVFNRICVTIPGRGRFVLKHTFKSWDCPMIPVTIRRIDAAGKIDMRYWRQAEKGEC